MEKTEYYLVNPIDSVDWFIGGFMPISKVDIKEWLNVSGDHGLPIANDMNLGTYFVQKDNSWLSYAYKEDTVTMGCVSRNAATADTYEAFKSVERIFLKHGGKPHWGKRFEAKDDEFSKIYDKWDDFKEVRRQLDPTDKFLNLYLAKLFNQKKLADAS